MGLNRNRRTLSVAAVVGTLVFVLVILPIWAVRPWERDVYFWVNALMWTFAVATVATVIGAIAAFIRMRKEDKRREWDRMFRTHQGSPMATRAAMQQKEAQKS